MLITRPQSNSPLTLERLEAAGKDCRIGTWPEDEGEEDEVTFEWQALAHRLRFIGGVANAISPLSTNASLDVDDEDTSLGDGTTAEEAVKCRRRRYCCCCCCFFSSSSSSALDSSIFSFFQCNSMPVEIGRAVPLYPISANKKTSKVKPLIDAIPCVN